MAPCRSGTWTSRIRAGPIGCAATTPVRVPASTSPGRWSCSTRRESQTAPTRSGWAPWTPRATRAMWTTRSGWTTTRRRRLATSGSRAARAGGGPTASTSPGPTRPDRRRRSCARAGSCAAPTGRPSAPPAAATPRTSTGSTACASPARGSTRWPCGWRTRRATRTRRWHPARCGCAWTSSRPPARDSTRPTPPTRAGCRCPSPTRARASRRPRSSFGVGRWASGARSPPRWRAVGPGRRSPTPSSRTGPTTSAPSCATAPATRPRSPATRSADQGPSCCRCARPPGSPHPTACGWPSAAGDASRVRWRPTRPGRWSGRRSPCWSG